MKKKCIQIIILTKNEYSKQFKNYNLKTREPCKKPQELIISFTNTKYIF